MFAKCIKIFIVFTIFFVKLQIRSTILTAGLLVRGNGDLWNIDTHLYSHTNEYYFVQFFTSVYILIRTPVSQFKCRGFSFSALIQSQGVFYPNICTVSIKWHAKETCGLLAIWAEAFA